MINWRSRWNALAARISGFSDASQLFARLQATTTDDPYRVIGRLVAEAKAIFGEVKAFQTHYVDHLPAAGEAAIARFGSDFQALFGDSAFKPNIATLRACVTSLTALRSELEYHFADASLAACRTTERAFVHLQRLIVVDEAERFRWQTAYGKGEVACERIGAVHLLRHGIWAFKVSAEGERTDLVLGDTLRDDQRLAAVADALVLTEWKLISDTAEVDEASRKAVRQAQRYSVGVLAGLELSTVRYVVLVSSRHVDTPTDHVIDGVTYRHVNIATDPLVPSRS